MDIYPFPCCVVLHIIKATGKPEKGGNGNKEGKDKKRVSSMCAYVVGEMGLIPK
jgi:hypothetical protein